MSESTLTVLGTGEAFDGDPYHTSLLLRTPKTILLLDCGALVPPRFWREVPEPDALHGIWVSHIHADHLFGLPSVLGRMWDDGRRRELALLGAAGVRERALALFETGYPGLPARLRFEIQEIPVEPGTAVSWRDLDLRTAETLHPARNLALRVEGPGGTIATYSGDGAPTPASAALGSGAHWVHECFTASSAPPGHADLETLAADARRVGPRRLGLVHVHRAHKRPVEERARALVREGLPVEVLVPGARWEL